MAQTDGRPSARGLNSQPHLRDPQMQAPSLGKAATVRKERSQETNAAAQDVSREVYKTSRRIPPSLERMIWMVKTKAKHSISLATNSSHGPEEVSHLVLGKKQDLRRPPGPKLAPLRRVDRWIEGH